MVKAVRQAEKSIGEISYKLTEKQIQGKQFSRSLYIVKDALSLSVTKPKIAHIIQYLHYSYYPFFY